MFNQLKKLNKEHNLHLTQLVEKISSHPKEVYYYKGPLLRRFLCMIGWHDWEMQRTGEMGQPGTPYDGCVEFAKTCKHCGKVK